MRSFPGLRLKLNPDIFPQTAEAPDERTDMPSLPASKSGQADKSARPANKLLPYKASQETAFAILRHKPPRSKSTVILKSSGRQAGHPTKSLTASQLSVFRQSEGRAIDAPPTTVSATAFASVKKGKSLRQC